MPRPVTLFTGQWADLPLEKLAPLAKKMGYDAMANGLLAPQSLGACRWQLASQVCSIALAVSTAE